MQLAFILYKYFPFGGLQRDFLRIALECQQRGHAIRVYTPIWEGEVPAGFEVVVVPVKALFNHKRNEKLTAWVKADGSVEVWPEKLSLVRPSVACVSRKTDVEFA